jgi:tetratricopeptide (TPR) repeat protein
VALTPFSRHFRRDLIDMYSSIRLHIQRTLIIATLCAGVAITTQAQEPGSVFARAKQLVVSGNGAAGRVLVDSVLTATTPDTPAYAEALYWRAALAASSADAERDYRRIVVEYPTSPHSGDALLQLAQLEVARGDRAAAAAHLQRFVAENPTSPDRTRVDLQLVRLLFDQNDIAHGCPALRTALTEIPDTLVETRNQLDYYSPRCVATDIGPGGRVPAPADTVRHDSTHAAPATTKKGATIAQGKYTLQIAAYKAKSDADALAKRLKGRKLDARVVGVSKLFRVRIGRYATRAEAVAEQKALKMKKIDAFVTDIGPDDK